MQEIHAGRAPNVRSLSPPLRGANAAAPLGEMERPSAKSKAYEQVELTPLGPDTSSLDEPLGKRESTWLEYAFKKLSALLWIVVAAALAWYIKLPDVVVASYDPDNKGKQLAMFWFNVGLAGFAGWCLMALYLVIWLKYIKRIEVEWEEYSPRAIPIATVCAVSSLLGCAPAVVPALPKPCKRTSLALPHPPLSPVRRGPCCSTECWHTPRRSFVVSFWAVWGLLTLPIIWFLFLGALNLAHFVPL